MTVYVSIRRAILVNNKKLGRNDGPFEVRKTRDDTEPTTATALTFENATVRLVYDKNNPLVSGAVCWLEVEEDVSAG